MASDTPRTDGDGRIYPMPENVQLIQFEGCTSAVMLPDEYAELYEHARQLERELAAMTAERDAIKTAREAVESERIMYRERAWHAESQLEVRHGLRKEINAALGLTDEMGDDALRKGLETIKALKSDSDGLMALIAAALAMRHDTPYRRCL